jgi:hypothetical protein
VQSLPFLSGHLLVGNAVVGMLAPDHGDEHAEVLADRDERRMLVVQAHSQTAINAVRR